MPNQHGWLNRDEVLASGKPALIARERSEGWEGKWTPYKPEGEILLNRTRCAALGAPVESGEQPVGYVYSNAPTHSYRYVPVYARSFTDLNWSKATREELKVRDTGPRK